jgi:NAD(P)-dependent dehydrogenase (short-subunit alcohol dehydrogenase family)
VTPQSYDELMSVNLRGPFFLTQEVVRRMLAAPASKHAGSRRNDYVFSPVQGPEHGEGYEPYRA